jgi:transcriptional regulator with XRE-family HTH domain
MKTASEKLNNLAKPSNWKEKLNYQIENEAWLDKSADIAFSVLETLEELGKSQTWLAEQLGVSRQHVSKIVKGKENLTLKTIYNLEQILNVSLLENQEEEFESETKEYIQDSFDQVFSNQNKEDKIGQLTTLLSVRFASEIDEVMDTRNIRKNAIAKEIETSPSYITQLLRGNRVFSLNILAKIAVALDIDFQISLKNKFESNINPPKPDGHGLSFYKPFKEKAHPKSDDEYDYYELESELSVA